MESSTKSLKNNEAAETGLGSGIEAETSCRSVIWSWGIERTFAAAIDLLSDVHGTFVFSADFHVDEATICRAIRRIAPLAERILKIKPEKLLSENDLQLLIVDATEQRIERPKNQWNYY